MDAASLSGCSDRAGSLLSETSCLELAVTFSPSDLDASGRPRTSCHSSHEQLASVSRDCAPNQGCGRPFTYRADGHDQICLMFRQQLVLEARCDTEMEDDSVNSVDASTRMIVVSWMVEVAEEFRLQQETLHLAVLLLDRFLTSSEEVPRCVLQLLAVGCIMLAAKDLEVSAPTVEQLCGVTANHFQPPDLLRMERIILNVLGFKLSSPSCYTFLHLFAQACSSWVSPAVLSLAMYLCELAMLDGHTYSSSCSYSRRAAAALVLAQLSLGSPQHTSDITAAILHCMGMTSAHSLMPCMAALLNLQRIAYQHTLAALAAAAAAQHAVFARLAPASAAAAPGHDPMDVQESGGAAQQHDDLLLPLRVKFGAECWCGVSLIPALQQLPLLL